MASWVQRALTPTLSGTAAWAVAGGAAWYLWVVPERQREEEATLARLKALEAERASAERKKR